MRFYNKYYDVRFSFFASFFLLLIAVNMLKTIKEWGELAPLLG
jgi:hypothetical protein